MTTGIRSDTSGTFGALTFGGDDVLRFGSDNSGHLAGFRNILINGDMRINQRGVTIAAAANGAYGLDRWKKVDASNMTQIVESGNFEPSTVYTLSGTGVTTQQITSPSSGNWTLPNIPITATKVQLEKGSISTPFELRPIGLELVLCKWYFEVISVGFISGFSPAGAVLNLQFPVQKRSSPTLTVSALGSAVGNAGSISITAVSSVVATKDGAYMDLAGSVAWSASASYSWRSGSIFVSAEL